MLAYGGDDRRLLGERASTQRGRADGTALGQQRTDVELALDPALHADDREPAVDGEGLDVAVEVLGAHVVEDDVGPGAVRGLLHLGHEVLFPVVDQDVRTQLGTPVELLGAARRDGDLGADGLGELDRHGADAAGTAVHQQGLAGAEVGDHEDVRPDRADHLGQGGGLRQAHALGHRQQLTGRHDGLLGVAAAREQRAHLVADGPAADTGTEFGDTAGALQPGVGGGAGRRVVEALSLQDVGAVDGPGHHLDQHLALAGRGVGDLVPHQCLGPTRFGNRDRMHGTDGTPRPSLADRVRPSPRRKLPSPSVLRRVPRKIPVRQR